jgi:hypothetical protein
MEVDVGRPAAAFEHELASKDMTNGRRACVSWCVPKRVPKAGKHGGEVPEAVEYALLARSTGMAAKMWTEVKGFETRDWQIRWKLFDALYPERDNRVIK